MSDIIKNRSEILFLYEVENNNPNGDPLNENRPRFDAEESKGLVSDVRLKRTIRDYWFEYKGFNGSDGRDIFVRETTYEDNDKIYIADGKRRAKAFRENKEEILKNCIDIRVFGGVLPLEKASITFTGPTQFQMGKTLNKTEIITEQGTGAFASGDKKAQATFRTEYKIPYALIGFNGIINEKAAAYSKMTESDRELLLEGIWEGTKNLISRSKFGQNPVALIEIRYNQPFYIGNLRQKIKLIPKEMNEMQIRSLEDYQLDFTTLFEALKTHKDKIKGISVKATTNFKVRNRDRDITLQDGQLNLDHV